MELAAVAPTSMALFDRAGLSENDAATHSQAFTLFAAGYPPRRIENEWSVASLFRLERFEFDSGSSSC
jgi:hypothetical protein